MARMDLTKANKAIKRAAIAGFIQAGMTAIIAVIAMVTHVDILGLDASNLLDIAVVSALAFGIFRRSRTCALIMLTYYVISQVYIMISMENVSNVFLALVFVYFYYQGVRGTFAYHHIAGVERIHGGGILDTSPHAGLGIASFVIGLGLLTLIIIIILVVGLGNPPETIQSALFFLYMVSFLIGLTGIILGIMGIVKKNRRRVFPITGLAVNGVYLLLYVWSLAAFQS